jgi:hypothetical protein
MEKPHFLWSRVLGAEETYQLEISEPIRVVDVEGRRKLFMQTYRIRLRMVDEDRCEIVATDTLLRDPSDPQEQDEYLEVEPMVYRTLVREFFDYCATATDMH